jgi:hypothetical protein
MQVVYARETLPESWSKSLFLAGPTPRSKDIQSWRPEALRLLKTLGYDGVVFVPEDRGMNGCAITPENYEPQIRWEHEALRHSDMIVFWVPRDFTLDAQGEMKFPGFTTNIEWGEQFDSGRVALGYPKETPKMGYFRTKAQWHRVPIAHSLEATISEALAKIGEGALREVGETCVPIDIWRTAIFQRWFTAQMKAGNRLLDANVLWTYRIGHERERLFFWALETDMHVGAENRVFRHGIVIGRPDVSGTVLFGPDLGFNTEVVLIREFRPAASTSDGFVHEPANGSSWQDLAPAELAAAETIEETGVAISLNRLQGLGERQLLPTLCPHRACAYFARLTKQELEAVRARAGKPHGKASEGEHTWIEIYTVREIFEMKKKGTHDLDWSTLGMVFFAFYHKV